MAGRSPWGRITLWDAAADGDLDKVKQKLENSLAAYDGQDSNGKTPLMEAARWNHLHVVKYLRSLGADLSLGTSEGSTAMHIAAEGGHNDVLSYLLDEGADVNAQDVAGDTPLMSAAGRGHASAVALLLGRGADLSMRNRNGKTAKELAPNSEVMAALQPQQYKSPTQY
eukprot:TRINITY_DN15825_c0_g1_i1.p2 TRINITY_DN15825_c0_g1~~TRINITY_DN15825_c0_g1_i1.p2  ORF type:complete len:169 (-),score=28.23 TRINITY_DN15825_c0_g1_i1:32-538(-)